MEGRRFIAPRRFAGASWPHRSKQRGGGAAAAFIALGDGAEPAFRGLPPPRFTGGAIEEQQGVV
jgi:hypothetical protein